MGGTGSGSILKETYPEKENSPFQQLPPSTHNPLLYLSRHGFQLLNLFLDPLPKRTP